MFQFITKLLYYNDAVWIFLSLHYCIQFSICNYMTYLTIVFKESTVFG